jgi:hypothetical protein
MGLDMIFRGFQPSDQQIEDLERGNPIKAEDHERDAEQQWQQHLQQQQGLQDGGTRTLRYCTQYQSDEEQSGDGQEEEHKEENDEEQKLSPDTQE